MPMPPAFARAMSSAKMLESRSHVNDVWMRVCGACALRPEHFSALFMTASCISGSMPYW